MTPENVCAICYSPTGTTRRVVEGIVEGTALPSWLIDLTLPSCLPLESGRLAADLLVVGVPVYGGRMAPVARRRLSSLWAAPAPVVLVAVYGNRAYEDALKEIGLLALGKGLTPVAAGTFIGEHSFSTPEAPIAEGRPDGIDLDRARGLSRAVVRKLSGTSNPEEAALTRIPGEHPPRPTSRRETEGPWVDRDLCVGCGRCISVCPTGTAKGEPGVECTLCSACLRACESGARDFIGATGERVSQAAEWLYRNFKSRREPEVFV